MAFTAVLLLLVPVCSCLEIQDLGDAPWTVENRKLGYKFPATVPGGIYTDLMKNGVIGDVFYGFNDINTRWVSKSDWNYSTVFTVGSYLLAHSTINLVFNGVDTFSTVSINNKILGETENMFVQYIFNIKPLLQMGNNTLQVRFRSPVEEARLLFERQARNYTVPPVCIPSEYNGECHVNHIRKMPSSFGWDWGPALPSMGIWKNVYIEAYNASQIRDVTVLIASNSAAFRWDVQFNIYLGNNRDGALQGTVAIALATDVEKISSFYKVNVKSSSGEFLVTKNISVPQSYVRRWWPNGYGNASLYPVHISFISLDKAEKSVKVFRIGFRTVDLVQNNIAKGRTFYFKINGLPIFAKGANSIPVNILPELGENATAVRFLLRSAKEANMNMLRVWGGGVYESDEYYKTADELGIMLWQDFMFACAMYPAGEEFLNNVREEVRHQVRRLQHHPSIIVWAGNNENEGALRENWYNTSKQFDLYKNDYVKLYVNTIKDEVLKYDSRPFVISSPTNGMESEKEGYIAKNPQSHFYGDVHYYNYLFDGWKSDVYPVSRFTSEFGYQSLPSLATWKTATDNESNLQFDSSFLMKRQHHLFGYGEMQTLINFQLRLPPVNSSAFMLAFIFYSQISQAVAVKIETECYRSRRSTVDSAGEGLTMGALFWQLNDVWVAPTWSSIDFTNKWKMLHYYAKDFFAPVIATVVNDGVFVISDLMRPLFNVSVHVEGRKWDSFKAVTVLQFNIQVLLPGVSQKLSSNLTQSILNQLNKNSSAPQVDFVTISIKNDGNESVGPNNFHFLTALKSANLSIPTVKVGNVVQINKKAFCLDVNVNVVTLFVWLEARGIQGRFSENGFIQSTPSKEVCFYSDCDTTLVEFKTSLDVFNLLDERFL